MNAYFFTGAVTQSQLQPTSMGGAQSANQMSTWDSILSYVVCVATAAEAQTLFEDYLCRQHPEQNPIQTEIRRIVGAQLAEKLLTEAGEEVVDWGTVYERIEATFFAQEEADQAEGYWADVNQLVSAGAIASDIETLRSELPEDVRSGLNWAVERQHFFLISSLSPMAAPSAPNYDDNGERADDPADQEPEDAMPELREKSAGALVMARNAVVAGWLWRKFAASTPYANDEIDMEPACGIYVPKPDEPGDAPEEKG